MKRDLEIYMKSDRKNQRRWYTWLFLALYFPGFLLSTFLGSVFK